jgi:predicted  nucleic acid-binding Zn-ribbon protein
VKVSTEQLDSLVHLYAKETELKKIKSTLATLASGDHLSDQHDQILALSQEVSVQRSAVEEIEREITRVAGDLEVVDNRIGKDLALMNQATNTKDIQGIQHELDSLNKRKDELETAELELMESIDSQKSKLEQLSERKRVLESELDLSRSQTKSEMSSLESLIIELQNQIGKLRALVPSDLMGLYDQRALRGVPVGKLLKSTCGACNMSLTSTALNDLHKIPADELARCPECTAILVRT